TNGSATLTTAVLNAGSHAITVSYGGDISFGSGTSAILMQTVNPANTTTSVTSSLNPSGLSQTVSFTATVAAVAPGSGTPTGTVTFLDSTSALTTALLSNGSATFATTALTAGTHSITVRYEGAANFATSTSTALTQTIGSSTTTTTVVSGANPSVFGQAIT